MKNLIPLIIQLVFSLALQAQSNEETKQNYHTDFHKDERSGIINGVIDSLNQEKIESWVFYTVVGYRSFGERNYEYLLWPVSNSSTHLLIFSSINGEQGKRIDYAIPDDSTFEYLTNHFSSIKQEQLVRFIFETNLNNHIIYSNLDLIHSSNLLFHCRLKDDIEFFNIPIYDIEESFAELINLNFKYNSSTHLFRLIKIVQSKIYKK